MRQIDARIHKYILVIAAVQHVRRLEICLHHSRGHLGDDVSLDDIGGALRAEEAYHIVIFVVENDRKPVLERIGGNHRHNRLGGRIERYAGGSQVDIDRIAAAVELHLLHIRTLLAIDREGRITPERRARMIVDRQLENFGGRCCLDGNADQAEQVTERDRTGRSIIRCNHRQGRRHKCAVAIDLCLGNAETDGIAFEARGGIIRIQCVALARHGISGECTLRRADAADDCKLGVAVLGEHAECICGGPEDRIAAQCGLALFCACGHRNICGDGYLAFLNLPCGHHFIYTALARKNRQQCRSEGYISCLFHHSGLNVICLQISKLCIFSYFYNLKDRPAINETPS